MKIRHLSHTLENGFHLQIDHLELSRDQSLLICGDNGSGKSLLAGILAGALQPDGSDFLLPENRTFLSFDLESELLDEDRKNDRSEEMEGGIDWGRTAAEIIGQAPGLDRALDLIEVTPLLDRPFKILSTGETRKVLLVRALAQAPDLMILDTPYAGLDIQARRQLARILETILQGGTRLILADVFHPDLPGGLNRMICLEKGKVIFSGDIDAIIHSRKWQRRMTGHITLPHHLPDCFSYDHLSPDTPFVRANGISASFYGTPVFHGLHWTFRPGQHWHIKGPNGCGKSTLLKMISGDSTKAYGQDLTLFGTRRGSGESIWDIKRHYGMVSTELHRDYRAPATLEGVVLSGFFDSIGLYDTPSASQHRTARQWIELLGMTPKASVSFSRLSYGEQRLALIARAVVKLPLVLILDEPCLGLDNKNRTRVLELVDHISRHSRTHILFVSHDPRDRPACLTHEMAFVPGPGGYLPTISIAP